MDNMNNTYTPSSSKITMTPEAIKKLVNNIVSVVLEGTTIVYPRKETSIPGKHNQESFMGYGPAHFKAPERMTIPTINQGIRQGVIPNGNNQKRKLTEIGTINPICCNFTNTQDCYRKHLEDRINYHRQLEYQQKANKDCLARPITENGYHGSQPLCQECGMHHTGICIVKCRKCQKTGHKANSCKDPDQKERSATVVCHRCGVKGHYKKQCPNYNVNWKAKTIARK
ncbi:reverse transcriptase domain-containing protein [Artemisia annua]|uniref:Reverse transcriptase domain-containing protein n=1 Tax=Artemisia annua TaxID=35608 RepID=A0A2U1MIG2_ARTAN|nr:reverse transcriptase domain-containing protein [Artemisia annua]